MANIFDHGAAWFASFLEYLSGDRTHIPAYWGNFPEDGSIWDNPHSYRLALLLERYNPALLYQWDQSVRPAAQRVQELKVSLEQLQQEYTQIAAQADHCQTTIKSNQQKIPTDKNEAWLELILPIGLSLMLVLGIYEIFGLDIQDLSPEQYFIAGLGLVGAISLNIAEYRAIVHHVQYLHTSKKAAPNQPFWQLIIKGNPSFYLALIIILFETAFAGPGLIGLLPPSLSRQFLFQVIVFLGAGLAAFLNVVFAWGQALPKLDQKEERLKIQELVERENQSLLNIIGLKKQLKKEMSRQAKLLSDAIARAILEHRRWERAVKRWQRLNADKIESFRSDFHSKPTPAHVYELSEPSTKGSRQNGKKSSFVQH